MTGIAPNLYRYSTKSGVRYATRVQIAGKQMWAKGFLTIGQARDYLRDIQVGRVEAKYFPERVAAPLLADYIPLWIKTCELRGLRRNTLRSYTQNLHDHVVPLFGNRALNEITRTDIMALLRQKQSETYSGNSIRLMIAPLSRLYADAIDEGLLTENPCLRPGRLLQLRKRKQEPIALTIEERDRLLWAFEQEKPETYALVCLLFMAGLRIGEAIALERTDPDLAHAALLVRFTYSNGQREPSTKNGRYRRVDLDPPLLPIVARQLVRLQESDPNGTLLFPGEHGGYLWERSWRRWSWEKMVQRSGIRRVTPHCARHTYATEMLNQGRSLQWLSAQLGHSSIQITVDTYGHMAQQSGYSLRYNPLLQDVTGRNTMQQATT